MPKGNDQENHPGSLIMRESARGIFAHNYIHDWAHLNPGCNRGVLPEMDEFLELCSQESRTTRNG